MIGQSNFGRLLVTVFTERGPFYKCRQAALKKQAAQNTVYLAPDVQAAFPTEEAVNAALRRLMQQDEIPAQQMPAAVER